MKVARKSPCCYERDGGLPVALLLVLREREEIEIPNRLRTGAKPHLRVALIGTRGIPASYGGFETAVEEVGRRLAERGHDVVVYGREDEQLGDHFLGMRRVTLPAVRKKSLETISHTALSSIHAVVRLRPEVAIVFNAANSPFLPIFRMAKIPVGLHMDGLEWKRSKWGKIGRSYYRAAESFGVRNADALIADSSGISDYYRHQFGAHTELIKYGAPQIHDAPSSKIEDTGIKPGGYFLVVARFEPENHVLEVIEGYTRTLSSKPLVVVGAAPYSADYTKSIERLAETDDRVRLLGAVYDQELLDALYFHAFTYIHGHSVGGTNPSLLRAIGAGTPVIGYDVSFNRDVVGDNGWYFSSPEDLAIAIESADGANDIARRGSALRQRAADEYTWNEVTDLYEQMIRGLASGWSEHANLRRTRRNSKPWPSI
ncbi:DUF1972 domain-containing protein [Gordonia sp. p3-SID1431]|uniref:DUF1972 domain-containing protein n=1 Tax=Gordonia sp. p3-SID1431 TaxID=2916159 RepID=UPI0021A4D0BD|nr:DUF1972 domain-containing protein [Gordonia sp. p3-SID1431]MCT1353177.1 DUF1972 domain-containing protein [Gordonia sp. p3-SID1431]